MVVTGVDEEGNAETARQAAEHGGRVLSLRCDATNATDVSAALERTIEEFGRLDIAFNPATHADPDWVPLRPTPPFPEYASAHATGCAAAFEVLTEVFGDGVAFENTSLTAPPGMPKRSFTGFHAAAAECADSRIQLGWHYRYATDAGLEMGRRVAGHVMDTTLVEVAYRTTSPIRRRDYHQRLAEALEAWQAGETTAIEPTADQIALHYDRGGSAAKAVDWYRRAAGSAMEVSALDAVRQLLGRALMLVERLPQSRKRDEMELDMRLNLGSALVALEGYGQARTVETYERTRELCSRLDRPVDSPILRALALAALSAGNLDAGSEFGRELARAAERDRDDLARVEGAYVSGVMAFWKGDLRESASHLSDAIAAYRPERHREHILLYAQDPKVVCLSRLAWTLWLQGRVTDALARRDEAIALAERHGDPMTHAYALWFTAFVAVDQGDTERLAAQAEQMKRIVTAHRLLYSEAVAEGLLGYVDAVRGDARRGIARMRDTLADPRWLGMEYVMKAQTLFLIARAAASAGDIEGGRDAVREALMYLGPGRSVWKAPLLQIDARLLGLEDRTGERALTAFRSALEEARACGAAWTELGVALDRARWVLERAVGDAVSVGADLKRALVAYDDSPPLPAVVAAGILLERLTPGGRT